MWLLWLQCNFVWLVNTYKRHFEEKGVVHSDQPDQPAMLLLQAAGRLALSLLGCWDGIAPPAVSWPATHREVQQQGIAGLSCGLRGVMLSSRQHRAARHCRRGCGGAGRHPPPSAALQQRVGRGKGGEGEGQGPRGQSKVPGEGSGSTQQVGQAVLVAAIQPLLATHNRQRRATQGCLERQLACVSGAGHVCALLVVCDGLVALQREGR